MKSLMTGIVLAVLVMVPIWGCAAGSTPAERASAAVSMAEASLQKGLANLAAIQKATEVAAANLDKAKADLQVAKASGDKEKIKIAEEALAKAKWLAHDSARRLKHVTDLVDRLKAVVDQVKAAASKVALAKTPADAERAADEAESKAALTARIELAVESAMKPRPPVQIIGVTIPATTTTTTRPTPTPVGQLP